MNDRVWVVLPSYSYGFPDLKAVFLTQEDAEGYAAHMLPHKVEAYSVREVPVMRFVPAVVTPATLRPAALPPVQTEGT